MRDLPPDSLHDPTRLVALRDSGLLDSPPEAAFDRFTRLARRLLHVPVALVSLVTDDRQFFKSAAGLAEPWATRRETPLSHSFCQYVVRTGEPFVVDDARAHPWVHDNPAIQDLGIMAYAGVPLTTPDGQVLGSCCVIDTQPRAWTGEELALLEDLAATIRTELTLRRELRIQQRLAGALSESESRFRTFIESLGEGLLITDAQDTIIYANTRMAELCGYPVAELLGRPAYALLLPPEAWPAATRRTAERLQGQSETYTQEARHKDGSPWWSAVVATPLRDGDGQIVGTLGAITDVTARRTAEQALAAAQARTAALYQVGRVLTVLDDLPTLLQAVVDSAAAALATDRVIVVTHDPAARTVTHLVAGGPGAARVVDVPFAELGEGLTGWVLRTRQPALSPRGAPDPRESPAVQARRAATDSGAIMVAPLIYREQVLGTITAIHRPQDPDFTTTDLELLQAMAHQTATALAQAQLFQAVQQQAITDPLTGLYNRRGFETLGLREVERARRSGRPLAFMVLILTTSSAS